VLQVEQVARQGEPTAFNGQIMLDAVRVEWGPNLMNWITAATNGLAPWIPRPLSVGLDRNRIDFNGFYWVRLGFVALFLASFMWLQCFVVFFVDVTGFYLSFP